MKTPQSLGCGANRAEPSMGCVREVGSGGCVCLVGSRSHSGWARATRGGLCLFFTVPLS